MDKISRKDVLVTPYSYDKTPEYYKRISPASYYTGKELNIK